MELNPRQKTGLMVVGVSLVFGLGILMTTKSDRTEEDGTPSSGNVYHDVPGASTKEVSDSKSETYIQERGRRSSAEDYWDRCAREHEEDEQQEEGSGGGHSGAVTSEQLFGDGSSSGGSAPPQRTYENPYRETPQEREERHRRRQEEALAMAERMSGRQPEDTASAEGPPTSGETAPEEPEQEEPRVEVRRTSVISSLEDGGQIGTLGSDDTVVTDDGSKPFPCMFSKAAKIRNGDRVSVILLEDIVVAGSLIPRNTHLMATCKVSTRLEIEIASLEMGGRILAFGYEAYDIDGSRGIYCPDVGNEGQTVRNRGTSIIGSTLTSRMGRVAGDVVSTGVSLLQGRNGEVAISVPAGYTFYIMKKKEQ